ncbi:hypothetical protein [Pseudogemmobacter hezensis]|uniref:hypothetical protein n=1 Tax=Pseudogemmobacter hezensis TaxID=2737662 RepID=UPI0034590406
MMGHVRVKQGRGLIRFGHERLQFLLPTFQLDHLLVETISCATFEDQVNERVELPVDLFDLGLCRVD